MTKYILKTPMSKEEKSWTDGWRFCCHYGGRRGGKHSIDTENNTITIEYDQLDDSRFIKDFYLEPGQRYRATVKAVGTNIVTQNEGGTGANICVMETWNHSSCDGRGTFAGLLTLDFKAPKDGKVPIGLRLGFWCCEAQGKVVFSDFHLEKNDEWVTYGVGQVRIDMKLDDVDGLIDPDLIVRHSERMSSVYYAMTNLYGSVPYNGEPIFIETRHGIGVWAFSGNPIVWNHQCCVNFFLDLERGDNACFGTIHEMGHNFDQTILTHINCEMMANLALCYAVENLGLPILFDNEFTVGRGLQDGFYKRSYDRSIAAGKYHHDGLLWCVLRIKDIIGWKPFEVVMRRLLSEKPPKRSPTETFDLWMQMLSDVSKFDVKCTFRDGEYELIMSQSKL